MNNRYILFLLLLFLMAYCKESFISMEFPTVLTADANYNGTAVILSGEVIPRNSDAIDEVGFVWQNASDPMVNPGFRISFSPVTGKSTFSYAISNSVKGNTDYFFRAYARQHGFTVYGGPLHFRVTQNIVTQSLFHITPSTGQAGDTVTIKGGVFNLTPEKNTVSFENISSEIVSVKDTVLKCIVPLTLNTKESTIVITIDGASSGVNQKFVLTTPSITSFSPVEAKYLDTITINGSGFHRIKSLNTVRFSGKEATIISSSSSQLKATVPFISDTLCQITVIVSGQSASSTGKLKITPPEVNGFYPVHGSCLDTIVIYCKNIKPEQIQAVKFGGIPADIIENSGSIIKVRVPVVLANEHSVLSVLLSEGSFDFPEMFTLDQPEIYSLSTSKTTSGGLIGLQGSHFNPVFSFNKAYLKDSVNGQVYQIVVNYSVPDSLNLKIIQPNNNVISSGTYTVGVQTCENIVWSPLKLYIVTMWNRLSDFPGSEGRYKGFAFSVNGKGYAGMGVFLHNILQNDIWEFNPLDKSWTRKADFPGPGRILPCVFQSDNAGYVGGGQSFDDPNQVPYTDFYKFTPSDNTWTRVSDIPLVDKSYPGASTDASGSIHVANLSSQNILEYNSDNNTWTQTYNGIAATNREPQAFSINGKSYFVGGANNQLTNGTNNQVWEYDPATHTMTPKNDFPGTSRYSAFSFSIGKYGYIGAGINFVYNVSVTYLTDVWRYDSETDTWTSLGEFPGGFKHAGLSFVIGDKAYILTGWDSANLTKDVWEFYDPAAK